MNQILNKNTGAVILESETLTVKELILNNLANLRDANLSYTDLSYTDLSYTDLSDANLRGANLSYTDLRNTDLSDANLSGANLSDANLRGANLRNANLSGANLSDANLSDANLSDANLRNTDLSGANLSYTDLRGANLRYTDLSDANLSDANLSDANLRNANLRNANLSGAKGLQKASDYLAQFEKDELGIIVYKRIGSDTGDTTYNIASHWKIEKGAVLTENPNPTRTQMCGCGVNFATLEWCKNKYTGAGLWKCRIEWLDLADICVPYNTDGKARCARLTLIEKVKV